MSKRISSSILFADDKDIQDLLLSSKLGKPKLLQLAQRRGIVLSKESSREQLVSSIARMPHSWSQLSELLDLTSTADRSDKRTCAHLPGDFTIDGLNNVLAELKDGREHTDGEAWDVVQSGKNQFKISATFTEVDPSKTRLAQLSQREIAIEIEKTDAGLQVRHSARERGTSILQGIVSALSESTGRDVRAQIIDLSEIRDPDIRTAFFINLSRGVASYDLAEILNVRGSRIPQPGSDIPNDDSAAQEDFSRSVKKIILSGRKIDQSPEYKRFSESRFFISEMTWTVVDPKTNGIMVEFEAGFSEDESARSFYYSVKRVHEKNKDGQIKTAYTRPSGDRLRALSQALEAAASEAQRVAFTEAGFAPIDVVPPVAALASPQKKAKKKAAKKI